MIGKDGGGLAQQPQGLGVARLSHQAFDAGP